MYGTHIHFKCKRTVALACSTYVRWLMVDTEHSQRHRYVWSGWGLYVSDLLISCRDTQHDPSMLFLCWSQNFRRAQEAQGSCGRAPFFVCERLQLESVRDRIRISVVKLMSVARLCEGGVIPSDITRWRDLLSVRKWLRWRVSFRCLWLYFSLDGHIYHTAYSLETLSTSLCPELRKQSDLRELPQKESRSPEGQPHPGVDWSHC